MSADEVTPVDRPTRNPDNAPMVMALFYIGGELRRVADTVKDLAKTLQNADEAVNDLQRERLAQALEETARAVDFGAAEVRGRKP